MQLERIHHAAIVCADYAVGPWRMVFHQGTPL
jgi:hypothetical protein